MLGPTNYRSPEFGPNNYLVVKEPNSSKVAPLIIESLPESRMILFVRDPRDVVASVLDARRTGNWLYRRKNRGRKGEETRAQAQQWRAESRSITEMSVARGGLSTPIKDL